jgi:hypothetical protein
VVAPPDGGIALPPGAGVPAPEPVVPCSCVRSKHCDDNPAGFANSHCAMVWKLHCADPVGPLRQTWPVPVCAAAGVAKTASVIADAAIKVRMVSPRVLSYAGRTNERSERSCQELDSQRRVRRCCRHNSALVTIQRLPASPAGGDELPLGGELEPEPTVPSTCERSTHREFAPGSVACWHWAMVWKVHKVNGPPGVLRQIGLVPAISWAVTDGAASATNVSAAAAIVAFMVAPL